MSEIHRLLESSSVLVLEDWAMMMVEPLAPGTCSFLGDDQCRIVEVDIVGPKNALLSIACQPKFLLNVARNVLGHDDDEEVPDEVLCDALKELANVVAGNFVTELYGKDDAYRLLGFRISEDEPRNVCDAFGEYAVSVFGDDEPVLITFTERD